MIEQIENCLIAHKDFITLAFTLVLILTSIAYVTISYLTVLAIRKQSLLQEWICLRNILHNSQLALFKFKSQVATAANEQQGIAADEAVANLERIIDMIQKRTEQIENTLAIQQQRERK